MKKQLNCEELGTIIKFDKHQVGQTLTGTKIELEKIKWENIKLDKHQVRQTLNNGWDKHWMGKHCIKQTWSRKKNLVGQTLSGKSIKWDKQ